MPYKVRVAYYCYCRRCLAFKEVNHERQTRRDAIAELADWMLDHLDGPCVTQELGIEIREYHEKPGG